MREVAAGLVPHQRLVGLDQAEPVARLHLGIEAVASGFLLLLQQLLEGAVLDAEHDIAIHLDEAPIAVVGEASIAAHPREAIGRLVVEAQVEDGVHHAGHRRTGARADGDQQRVVRVAEAGARDPLDIGEASLDLRIEACGQRAPAS